MCECICKHLSLCIAVLSMDTSPSKLDKKQGQRDIDITFSFAYMYVICYWNQFVPLLSNECILMKQKSHHEYCDTLLGVNSTFWYFHNVLVVVENIIYYYYPIVTLYSYCSQPILTTGDFKVHIYQLTNWRKHTPSLGWEYPVSADISSKWLHQYHLLKKWCTFVSSSALAPLFKKTMQLCFNFVPTFFRMIQLKSL